MKFDIGRLRKSDQLIGGGAIALFIFLFLFKWYGGSASSSVGGLNYSASYSGWHTFTNSRWIWLITILVALGAVAVSAGVLSFKSPIQPGVLVAGLGALSTLLILYRIVHHPSGGISGSVAGVHYSTSYGIKIGIWLGLIAAGVLTYGGYRAMQDEGTSLSDVREQAGAAVSGVSAQMSGSSATAAAPTATEPTETAPPAETPRPAEAAQSAETAPAADAAPSTTDTASSAGSSETTAPPLPPPAAPPEENPFGA